MTTTTVFGSTADGRVYSNNASYATAVAGSNLALSTGGSAVNIGQDSAFNIYQSFFAFDTSAIPDGDTITQVDLALFGSSNSSITDFVLTALDYDWSSGGLTTADFRTPTQLSALNTLATLNTSSYAAAYMTLTSAGAAFNNYINKTGTTYLMVVSNRNISATQPIADEFIQVFAADEALTTNDPKLVITHASVTSAVLAAGAGSFAITGTNAALKTSKLVAGVGSYTITGTAATLTESATKSVAAGAGAFLLSGQAAFFIPLYPNSIAQNPLNYIYGTDPDQFDHVEYLGLLTFEIYPSTNLPTHIFRVYFRDIKQAVVTLGSNPFAMTNLSAVVRVTHTAHGYSTGNYVNVSNSSAAGGIQISGTYALTYASDDTYDITHSSAANATTTGGGASVVATYNQFRVALDEAFGYAGAKAQALLVGPRLGKLPFLYRNNINYVIIHPGDGTFTSEDAGHFFVLYADRIAVRISNDDFEESCFHEGTHSSIQKNTGGKGINYIDTAEWDAAVAADNAYITEYASTAEQEDFAESALFGRTVMLHPERLQPDLAAIQAIIPNRIAFWRTIFAGHQIACARVSASSVAAKLPTRFIDSLVNNTSLLSHCRDLANLKVQAYYSNTDFVAGGVPDLYKFYCTVCGRVHPRSPVGNEPRPYWNVR